MAKNTSCGVQLRIRGKVQGVGFRPFVWQLAQQLNLHGDVCNDGDGVKSGCGKTGNVSCSIVSALPAAARIDSVEREPFIWSQLPTEFTIRQSTGGTMNTQIVPDAATCPACLAEMNTPGERRYRYPFINCTHCGPRFTIIRAMPYDRPFTVMAAFPLCPACDKEYRDPLDRALPRPAGGLPGVSPHLNG
ncbi:acylphosphatase [Escherichia coli]